MRKILCMDCDSTLSAIEGVDELAAIQGADVEAEVRKLTNMAMNGELAIDEIFTKRLDVIKPSLEQCKEVGEKYIVHIVEGVEDTLLYLKKMGWEFCIISGGFTQVIEPLADYLDIQRIYSVDLNFNKQGDYVSYNKESPTAKNGGKPEIIRKLRQSMHPEKIVMIGDGVSDLEAQEDVDMFIGFGGVESREKVKKEANYYIEKFSSIISLLES